MSAVTMSSTPMAEFSPYDECFWRLFNISPHIGHKDIACTDLHTI